MVEARRNGERRVASDPSLRPEETETCLHILGDTGWVDVHTLHPSAMRGLLALPEFEVLELNAKAVRGETRIVGVKGRFPVGCLRIGRGRKDSRLSRVFSRRRDGGGGASVPRSATLPPPQTASGTPSPGTEGPGQGEAIPSG